MANTTITTTAGNGGESDVELENWRSVHESFRQTPGEIRLVSASILLEPEIVGVKFIDGIDERKISRKAV